MKIDFHIHAKLSKKVEFSMDYLLKTIGEAKKEGINAFTLTEHFNTHHFFDIYDTLDQSYEYIDQYYDIEGFRLFPGMEVDIQEGGHILIIGDREPIRKVRRILNVHEEEKYFIPMQKLLEICRPYELLKIGAHPLRESNCLERLPKELFKQLDALDLNAKDLNHGGEEMYKKVHALAQQVNLPVVGGSDTHHFLQAGSIMNIFEEKCDTLQQIKDCIKEGRYDTVISPDLKRKVSRAEEEKKKLLAQEWKRIS